MPISKVWIYRLLCLFVFGCLFLCVCTVADFSTDDKANSVKFCTVVQQCPGQGISHFGELCSQKPKIGRIGHSPGSKGQGGKSFCNRVPINIARRVGVGSACVDIRPSPKTDVLVVPMSAMNF